MRLINFPASSFSITCVSFIVTITVIYCMPMARNSATSAIIYAIADTSAYDSSTLLLML